MPFAAKRPCPGGCGRLVSYGYCEPCRARGRGEDQRPTAAQRGYGARWQRVSKAYLAAHPLCVGEHGEVEVAASCVDHIIPHRGDMRLFWDSSNWQPLCHRCHSRKTAMEDGGFGHRR
ncbi:MAG TPA: HNH endonuclease signature motif containing protein [Acidisarcina sp.]|nr:HNH endonuclease signature motif containing protein [Acidisarcina sp.]